MPALRAAFASFGLLCGKDLKMLTTFIQTLSAQLLDLGDIFLREYFLIFGRGSMR